MVVLTKIITFVAQNPGEFLGAIRDHMLYLVAAPVGLAILIAVPLGILATRYAWLDRIVSSVVSVLQTIPSLAMLAFLIVIGFGLGYKPSITALFLYSLLPIYRNTYTGIKGVDPFVKEAAAGMGMTNLQRLFMIELPLSMHVIMAGVRTAAVICIGTGTLAAFIGAGGLGSFIVRGLQLLWDYMIILGAIPAAIMALLVDYLLGKIEYLITPRGLRL